MSQFLLNERFGNGQDSAYNPSTGTDSPTDSVCTGTSGTKTLSATNVSFAAGQIILIHQTQGVSAGAWELNVISSYVSGTIATKYALANTYVAGAQVLVLKQYNQATIAGGVTITTKAWNGTTGGLYVLLCNGAITVTGTITATAKGFRGGLTTAFASTGGAAEGTVGAAITTSSSANGNGGGGGPSTKGAGGGGNGAAGATPSSGGTGGSAAGAANLITMVFGGGGGSCDDASGGSGPAGSGPVGGGIVILIGKSITVSGSIVTNGTNGAQASSGNHGGSAGSAGGSVLLKALNITLGTALITATAGTGGAGQGSGTAGGNGAVGRIHADYSQSISGTTSPTIDTTLTNALSSPTFGFVL